MAQLFTVYFPKYCFEVQEEFTIQFPNAQHLPFEPSVSENGIPHIKEINFDETHTPKEIQEWTRKGLKVGLRIVAINDDTLANEQTDGAGDDINLVTLRSQSTARAHSLLQTKDVLKKIKYNGSSSIHIAFREHIPVMDDSEPLGLERHRNTEHNTNIICDTQISVSSYDDAHDPTQCRLNNPSNYWSPSIENETARDVWICFDLKDKKFVDKIRIQGDLKHSAYVQSFWIEYSNDLCEWRSHPMGRIQCKYIASSYDSSQNLQLSLPSPLAQDTSVMPDYTANKNQSMYHMAIVKLWPVIHAQFIRIRPYQWKKRIAMRLELFGNERDLLNQPLGKIVSAKTVSPQYKEILMEALTHKSMDTKAIQIDCKAIVIKAMASAGCTSYGVIDTDQHNYLLVFTTPNSARSERVMDALTSVGVGRQMGVISATAVEWRNAAPCFEKRDVAEVCDATTGFYSSVKSHKVIKVVVERIMNGASFTFDYACMLTIASMIAVGGLATNSAVIVVASMLVSPIMGPVLAFTFGVTLRNRPMAKLGIRNEVFSLFICIIIGFVVGFFYALGTNNRNDWPTEEMASRGNPWALADGAFIAFASGIGVALSVIGDYLSTVIGVAISASLLPPAVNSGMLLSFTIYEKAFPQYISDDYDDISTIVMAVISLILTIENIIIIFLSARMMFWIKTIVRTQDRNQTQIWDNIKHFNQQNRQMKRDNIEPDNSNNHVDIKFDQNEGATKESYDLFIKQGGNVAKAVNDVKDTFLYDEAVHAGSVKCGLFRQVSSFYNADDEFDLYNGDDEFHQGSVKNMGSPIAKRGASLASPAIASVAKIKMCRGSQYSQVASHEDEPVSQPEDEVEPLVSRKPRNDQNIVETDT
eukprot:468730_1